MITQLTGSGDGGENSGRMPSSNTSDFSETSMRFFLQMSNTESFHNSGETFTFGNSNNVNHFTLSENGIDFDGFFEQVITEFNFLFDGTSVQLDFHNVIFLLSEVQQFHLSVDQDSNNGTVFSDSVKVSFNTLRFFSGFFLIFGESFLFRVVPVFVESSQGVSIQLVGPNGSQSSQTSGGVYVSD